MTKKIEMSKNEAKEAGKLNSEKFHELRQFMAAYPGYEIQIKAPAKRKVELKGLDYKYMRAYILKCNKENKEDIMDKFNDLIAQEKKDGKEGSEYLEAAGYLEVRAWFLKQFPEIEQRRDDHKKKVQAILAEVA
jgi:uncharacterized protein YozE (UPF0346 family)